MPERNCPQCTQLMLVGRMGPLELDVCRPCGGVWFDCGELAQLIAAGPQVVHRLLDRVPPLQPRSVPAIAPCPLCRVTLQSVEYASMPGIRLDACPFCEGFWMPHTTLQRLAAALDGSRQWNQINAYATPAVAAAPAAPAVPAHQPAPTAARPAGPPPAAVPPPWQPAPVAAAPTAPARPGTPTRTPSPPAGAKPGGGVPSGMSACPKCNELNGESAVVCWACGSALQGAKVGDCPRCAASMREIFSETVAVNLCDGCGSCATTPKRLNAILLQPHDSRDRLLKYVGRSRRGSRPTTATPQCPSCKVTMNETRLGMMSQLPLHACGECYMLLISPTTLEDILVGQR